MVKIFIDPGHGEQDPGAVGNGLKEKDLVLDIAKRIDKKLKAYKGVRVKLSRTNDTFLSLSQRANLANDWGADYFLSIHINAGGGQGYEDFIYNQTVSDATRVNQNIMNQEIIGATGFSNRGKKQANFAVLRLTNMPAILTENGFVDNSEDAKNLKSSAFLDKIAQGHVNGLVKIFGLSKSKSVQAPKHTPSNAKKERLTVDGKWAEETTGELQEYLGTPVDNVISNQLSNAITQAFYGNTIDFNNSRKGSTVIKALQRLIGAKADGLLGPATIRALQKYLGTEQDGVLSRPSLVVEELQRRLNAGTI